MGSKSRSRSGSGSGTTSFDDDEGLLVAKEGMRTIENVKIVEVHCGISSDSLEYACTFTRTRTDIHMIIFSSLFFLSFYFFFCSIFQVSSLRYSGVRCFSELGALWHSIVC